MIKNLENLKNICKQLPKKGKYQISCSTEQYKVITDFMSPKESEPVLEIDSENDTTDLIGIKMMGYEFIVKKSSTINTMNTVPNLNRPIDYLIEAL